MPVKRVLFFAEAVTLAHVARPAVLAAGLDATRYDVHLALCLCHAQLLSETPPWIEHELTTIPSAQFAEAHSCGAPTYSEAVLRANKEEDLALIERVKPDVVVGDFRISLAVSAVKAGVPHVATSNAYRAPTRSSVSSFQNCPWSSGSVHAWHSSCWPLHGRSPFTNTGYR